MFNMKRRAFLTPLGGAAAWPLAARAQQARKTHTIGFLSPSTAVFTPNSTVLLNTLIEGQNIAIERRYAEKSRSPRDIAPARPNCAMRLL